MKQVILFFFLFAGTTAYTQPKQKSDFGAINWNNYSTSFIDAVDSKNPIIITAIPYNGFYSNFDDNPSEIDLIIDTGHYRYRSNFRETGRHLYSYDSSEAFFLIAGINPQNAHRYAYRVWLNKKQLLKDWSTINQFSDSNFQLNNFEKSMGFIGGYQANWNEWVVVEIIEKETNTIITTASVYWKQTKPAITNVYTSTEMNLFLTSVKNDISRTDDSTTLSSWEKFQANKQQEYFTVSPGDDNIIIQIDGSIYKKEALEYRIIKNARTLQDWQSNDFDNNFIWLRKLNHGVYQVSVRFSAQRHNETTFDFAIQPYWYQTNIFKILTLIIIIAIAFLLLRIYQQKIKIREEKIKKEKSQIELKALQAQLNPHFVFNALSSIQSLVNTGETEAANTYLTDFSSLLRYVIQLKPDSQMPIEQEMRYMETYLRLEQMRFQFTYEIINSLFFGQVEIPAMLLQPVIENAIKHGVGPLYKKGHLVVNLATNGTNLIVNIIDNGKGISIAGIQSGKGHLLVNQRIEVLNEQLTDQKISFSITGNKNGTTASFIFENWMII